MLQMGTGDVVRTISLQVMHHQNDGAAREDYGLSVLVEEKSVFVAAA